MDPPDEDRSLRKTPLWAALALAAALAGMCGCGTTRWSDTQRTATEQLLISNAIDKAIAEFNFTMLEGREVFFDSSFLKGVTDENYIVSSMRQHLLASGCILRESKEQAEFVVEARSGGVGTDRSDLLFGVPAVTVPSVPGMALPSTIPELPLAKSTNQKAVAKLAVFAYNRETGRPVMQTGVDPITSTAKNSWIFGAGPFQRGSVYEGTKFAGDQFEIPIIGGREDDGGRRMAAVPLTEGAVFAEGFAPQKSAESDEAIASDGDAQGDESKTPERVVRLPNPQGKQTAPAKASAPAGSAPSNPVQRAEYQTSIQGSSSGLPDVAPTSAAEPGDRKPLFPNLQKLFSGRKSEEQEAP